MAVGTKSGEPSPVIDRGEKYIGPVSTQDDAAKDNASLYTEYRAAYQTYRRRMEEDWQFARLAQQWTPDEVERLAGAGQSPMVFNHLRRICEQYVAMMAGRAPRWAVIPRLSGNKQVAGVLNDLLAYIWHISEGNQVLSQVITDMVTRGSGHMMAYLDPNADFGRGDIRIAYLNPLEVYWDPSSRSTTGEDAEHVIVSKLVNRSRLAQLYPDRADIIEKAAPDYLDEDYVKTEFAAPWDQKSFAHGDLDKTGRDQLRIIDRYTRVLQEHVLVSDPITGAPIDLVPASEDKRIDALVKIATETVRRSSPNAPNVEIPRRQVNVWRVRQITSITTKGRTNTFEARPGGEVLVDQIIPIRRVPVVPIFNIHAGNPFSQSEVRDLKSVQQMINKMCSLAIKSATGLAGGGQWLVPAASGAKDEIEDKGGLPGAVIEWHGDQAPAKVPPGPMPDGHFALIQKAESVMDSVSGMSAQLQGAFTSDRESARSRALRQEESSRRPDQKLRMVEESLSRLGEVVVEMSQKFYTGQKVFSLSDTAGRLQEIALDPSRGMLRGVDGRAIFGSINTGQYDTIVTPGSTRPSNRQQKLNEALELKTLGIYDNQAVLEAMDDPDSERVAQRTAEIAQLGQQNQQLSESVNALERKLAISENESLNARKAVEVSQQREQLGREMSAFRRRLDTIEKSVAIAGGNIKAEITSAGREAQRELAQSQSATPSPPAKGMINAADQGKKQRRPEPSDGEVQVPGGNGGGVS